MYMSIFVIIGNKIMNIKFASHIWLTADSHATGGILCVTEYEDDTHAMMSHGLVSAMTYDARHIWMGYS